MPAPTCCTTSRSSIATATLTICANGGTVPFTFVVTSTGGIAQTLTVAPGACVTILVPAGATVTIQEQLPSGVVVTSIVVVPPSEAVSVTPATGTAVVHVSTHTTVTFNNAAVNPCATQPPTTAVVEVIGGAVLIGGVITIPTPASPAPLCPNGVPPTDIFAGAPTTLRVTFSNPVVSPQACQFDISTPFGVFAPTAFTVLSPTVVTATYELPVGTYAATLGIGCPPPPVLLGGAGAAPAAMRAPVCPPLVDNCALVICTSCPFSVVAPA